MHCIFQFNFWDNFLFRQTDGVSAITDDLLDVPSFDDFTPLDDIDGDILSQDDNAIQANNLGQGNVPPGVQGNNPNAPPTFANGPVPTFTKPNAYYQVKKGYFGFKKVMDEFLSHISHNISILQPLSLSKITWI